MDSRALRKTVFIPRALAGGGAVADACSAVVFALRDGAVAVFSLPKLDWLVCVAAGGIAGVGRSLRDAFAPSPVVWPTWEAAGERLVLLAESDGAVDVWHLPSLLHFARDRLHATAERAVRRASLGRDSDLAAAAEAAAAAAEPPSPPKPPPAASAVDAVSIKPAIELRHAQLPAAHHAARDGAPPPVRRFEFLPAGGQATSWVGVLSAPARSSSATANLPTSPAAASAFSASPAAPAGSAAPRVDGRRCRVLSASGRRAARAEAAAAAARRVVAPLASALRGSASAPTLLSEEAAAAAAARQRRHERAALSPFFSLAKAAREREEQQRLSEGGAAAAPSLPTEDAGTSLRRHLRRPDRERWRRSRRRAFVG